jgi:hypothetical protein
MASRLVIAARKYGARVSYRETSRGHDCAKRKRGHAMDETKRFAFIGHALRGDGPFRPQVTYDSNAKPVNVGQTYLNRYPREADDKFARRNEVAFYESPLHRATSRFVSHITKRAVAREIPTPLLELMSQDIDLKGNAIDVFWQSFMVEAKARGSMLLLVDMPSQLGGSAAEQLQSRRAPYWTPIDPALVSGYERDETGKFATLTFSGTWYGGGEPKRCFWTFTKTGWNCVEDSRDKATLGEGEHPLGECPVLAFTETGDYPSFGSFSAIADLAKRLFNLDSELDEILRAQTFSLLTMGVAEGTSAEELVEVAKKVGETISTENMMVYTGSQPGFIAPPDGPARVYMDRITAIQQRIRDIGLEVATINERESGIAMQTRFELINAELTKFAERIEDLERRAWRLSVRWLGLSDESMPTIAWPRDFNVAEISDELDVLSRMSSSAMPEPVIRAQQKRIVDVQFDGADDSLIDELKASIDQRASAV